MNKALMEQLELEKRKREILKEAQNNKKETGKTKETSVPSSAFRDERPYPYDKEFEMASPQKFAWEYELERYRKDKLKDQFYFLGAVCGILALILTLYFNASQWLQWF